VNACRDQVMHGCGFQRKRVGHVVYRALELADDRGEDLPATATAMIAAWHEQARCRGQGLLRAHCGPEKFFGDGHWNHSDGWHWDNQAIQQKRNAGVGLRP
jgi:hypothetical protein